MNERWTPADEALFRTMVERRTRVEVERRIAVADAVERLGLPVAAPFLLDALIANADAIRDALLPFDSGVRAEAPR